MNISVQIHVTLSNVMMSFLKFKLRDSISCSCHTIFQNKRQPSVSETLSEAWL